MNSPVRSVVSLSLSLLVCLPAVLMAETPEEAWKRAGSNFDNLHAVSSLLGDLHATYSGDPVSRGVERNARTPQTVAVELETQVYRVFTTLEPVLETYEDLECREVEGEGRGDWHGLFSAPKREKAKRLADAVQGIGEGTAQCIIDSGAFSSKPRSWSAFQKRIREAEEVCGKGIYYRVVVQHGRDNVSSLGYYNDQDCRTVQRQERVNRPVEHREPDHMARVTVQLTFRGGPLRPSESESFSVHYDGITAGVEPSSRYNRYQVTQTGASDFVLDGQRQRTTPTNTLSLEVLRRGLGMVIQLTDPDSRNVIGESANAQTFAMLKIRQKVIFDWKHPIATLKDKTVGETTIPLYGGGATPDLEKVLGNLVPRGEKYYFEYALVRKNSLLNNDKQSNSKESVEFTR